MIIKRDNNFIESKGGYDFCNLYSNDCYLLFTNSESKNTFSQVPCSGELNMGNTINISLLGYRKTP